jgi:isoleucyl-tRNA synthetase
LMAPILPFTADEIWSCLPGSRCESVHLEKFPSVDHLIDPNLIERWSRLLAVRNIVNAALEEQRRTKNIGNSLGARIQVRASGPIGALLDRYRCDLAMLFIVSEVTLDVELPDGVDELSVEVYKATGARCERCWRFVPHLASDSAHAGLCDRCVDALVDASTE